MMQKTQIIWGNAGLGGQLGTIAAAGQKERFGQDDKVEMGKSHRIRASMETDEWNLLLGK